MVSCPLKFKYSFSWKISLCLRSFHSYLQVWVFARFVGVWCVICGSWYAVAFPLRFLLLICLFCLCVRGKKKAVLHMLLNMFIFWCWKVKYRFPKAVCLGKKTEDFFLIIDFLLLVLQKTFIFIWNTTRMSKHLNLLSVLQTSQFSFVLRNEYSFNSHNKACKTAERLRRPNNLCIEYPCYYHSHKNLNVYSSSANLKKPFGSLDRQRMDYF